MKKWDSLLVKEKEDRHTQLLQRMALQQKLISKNDLLFKQAEREAMEKREKVPTILYIATLILSV